MKALITSAVCSSLLIVAGCNNTDNETSANQSSASVMQKTALASGIEKVNMDLTVRPQDNFYLYMNGGWLKSHTIPGDKTAIGSFYDLRDKADDDVKAIITELAQRNDLKMGSDEQKVAGLYRSYMDTEQRDNLGTAPVQPIFDAIKQLKDKKDLAQFFGQYQAMGVGSPLAFYISVDAKDSSRYATHIWQSGLGLPDQDYYINEKERFVDLRSGYIAHIEKMFDLAGLANGDKTYLFFLE